MAAASLAEPPLQSSNAVRVLSAGVREGGTRKKEPTPPSAPTNTPPCPPVSGETATFLFLRRFPKHEGREMPHPGRECSSRNRNAIVSKRASMSFHLPGSNPCRLLPGGCSYPCCQGRTGAGVTPESCISMPIFSRAAGYSGNFLTREDLGLSQECGILVATQVFKTPADISHSLGLSGCNKAHPLPEAKPTKPMGLPDHAHLLSSINQFEPVLFSCEPGNTQ